MKLTGIIVMILFNIWGGSSQTNVRSRDLYELERKMKKMYPSLCKRYYDKYNSTKSLEVLMAFNVLSSLRLPPDPFYVMEELEELNFKEGNYQAGYSVLLELEGNVAQEATRGLKFHEAVALVGFEYREGELFRVNEIDADDEFKQLLLSAIKFPKFSFINKIRDLIVQGVSLDILKKLMPSTINLFWKNAHLNLWKGPFGDLLLDYASRYQIIYYDFYTLDYLENNTAARDWIMLADLEGFPVETIVLMFDFPEQAEHIYKAPKNEKLKGVFADISGWRRGFVEKVDWAQIKWTNNARREIQMTSSLLPFKGDLFLHGLVSVYRCPHTPHEIFESKLRQDYFYDLIINERQELIYLHLKDEGYPIQDIFTTPNDELESHIWEHFKLHPKGMDWADFMVIEIIRNKLSFSHSRVVFGGKHLVEEYFRRCSDNERSDLLFTINVGLYKYFGGGPKARLGKDLSCVHGVVSASGQHCNSLYKFKEKYLDKVSTSRFYHRVVEKLKQESDLILKDLLLNLLERIISKTLGSFYKKTFKAMISNSNILRGAKENAHFQAWTDDILDLAENIKQLYLLYHPQDIFKHKSIDEAIKTDKRFLRLAALYSDPLNNINPEDKILLDESSSEDECYNFTRNLKFNGDSSGTSSSDSDDSR